MAWLLINWNEESCFYFALGFSFTEFLNLWFVFGISTIRFVAVMKKKGFKSLDQLEDGLVKFMFPIFLTISLALIFTMAKSMANILQQVRN